MYYDSGSVENKREIHDWGGALSKYGQSNLQKAIGQLLNTFIPYSILWGLMIFIVKQGYSYWILLAMALPAAFFLIRIFIFFHDCCHGSFFKSRRANKILGFISGLLAFTPYESWRHSHAIHHATAGDLDRRGTGDVWTMTVDEYKLAPWKKRIAYRVFRNPLIMFGIGPSAVFFIAERFAGKGANKQDRLSVIFVNISLLAIIGISYLTIGIDVYLMIQIPVMAFAATIGVWLFYVQHQFENVYWARHEQWQPQRAALEGSSYYKLPRLFQWLTGNIGLHHIHHIRSSIPNYNLQQCYKDIPEFQAVTPLTFRTSLKSLWLNIYDEKQKRLISFRKIRKL